MSWRHRLRNVFRPDRLNQDLERELSFHLMERADELHQHGGLSPAEATRRARLQFGNLAAQLEGTRDMNINTSVEAVIRNVRYALRSLAKAPAFSVTVLLTLALGIGANSAVFSTIYAVLIRPLPFPANELVEISQSHPNIPRSFVAPVRLEEWNRLKAFSRRSPDTTRRMHLRSPASFPRT
jgi:hypothetical protein